MTFQMAVGLSGWRRRICTRTGAGDLFQYGIEKYGEWPVCTSNRLVVYNQQARTERASYNGSIEASQASDVGSIPIARSIKPVDAVGFTGFHP